MDVVCYQYADSPIGRLLLAATEKGLCNVEFNGASEDAREALEGWMAKRLGAGIRLREGGSLIEEAARQLKDYFGGSRTSFDLPLDLRGTPFQLQVWRALGQIPYGQIRSYKQIAEAIGSPKAVRAVGGANNRNPVPIIIPCHRVIGAGGALVGYGGGLPIKQFLLHHEGIPAT
ncbi:methylated-DNA--[protein]-cysteine S-methyltransferase [Gorillibacterium sp. sgz5001074]|uniref:methylated-DNA--[protein]-cysteine S-methyltransferase n=1 Tax=Gorillibacterium sp. sgz5001074 TaxID=3446695 RepID=UPI003F6717D8